MTNSADSPTRSGSDLALQLWQLWRQGRRPDLRQFLAAAGEVRPAELLAVLRVDQRERWQAGERPPAEEYLEQFPALRADLRLAAELVRAEHALRHERGESPELEEYLRRFPNLADLLRQTLTPAAGEDAPSTRPAEAPGTLSTAGAPPFRETTPLPAFPGYDPVRELGRGGMGIVYQAFDRKRQKMVALKTMQGVDPGVLLRFKQEFRTLAGLQHPNLVTLYELVGDGLNWFFTMELVEGVHFLAHVRAAVDNPPDPAPTEAPEDDLDGVPTRLEGPPSGAVTADDPRPAPGGGRRHTRPPGLTPAQLARLRGALAQLAAGVHALHQAGTLHRDIKPGNVLVSRQGRVILLDFGLATELDRFGQHRSIHLLGTVAYMAPEQAARQTVSPASDWYAVGVILHEALTGRLPFDGDAHDILFHKQQHEPPPVAPSPSVPEDLAALCTALLRRDPAARPSGEEILRRLGPRGAPAAAPQGLEVPLIGRERHLQALAEAYEETCRGRTVVVDVHGRSGAGKTALVQRFLDGLAERGEAVLLRGRCYEQESVPYKALDSAVDALCRYLERLDDADVQALLPRDVQTLARVFPVLRRIEAVAGAPRRAADVSDPQEVRRRALAALRDLLGRLGEHHPLVLAIDDLQWGDVDSAALLKDLLRPPDPPALLLLLCYRSEEAATSPCLRALLPKAGGEGAGPERRELAVEPLSPPERRQLALALLDPRDEAGMACAETIARQSGGYPFFVYELAQFVQGGGPPCAAGTADSASDLTLSEVLWVRIRRLPEPARRLLELVAVAGRPLRQADALAAADVGTDGHEALASLRAGRLLRSTGPADRAEVETYHDRIRETVVAHLGPDTLRQHHTRLAAVLEAAGGADPELLAVHLQGAGDPRRAGHYYARAAAQAAETLAFDRAANLYRLALDLQELDGEEGRRLRVRLGDALASAGRGAESARTYLAALPAGETTADASQRLELQRRAALQFLSSGHVDDGLATLRTVLAAVGLRLFSSPRRAFWGLVWQRLRLGLRGLRFRRRTVEQIDPGELARFDICYAAAVGLSMVDTIQGAYFQTRGLLMALAAGEPIRLVSALALEAAHASISGNRSLRRTERLLRAADALAHEVGLPYPRAVVSLAGGLAAALRGSWRDALTLCDGAERIFRESCNGVMWELGTAHRFALWPLMFMGEVAELARRIPRLVREARQRDDLYGVSTLVVVVRSSVRLAADEPERARAELAEVMDRWSQQGFHVQHMNRVYDEAQTDLYQGHAEAAWRRVGDHWRAIRRAHMLLIQQVRIILFHLRARCALAAAGAAGDRAAYLRSAERDARALEREKLAWADALAKLIRAGLAARRCERALALEELAAAVDGLTAADMRLYAEAARRRRGQLLGGEEGRELVRQADAWMAGQKIKNPERMTDMLAPGFD
jgi:serine/threonine protein kinase